MKILKLVLIIVGLALIGFGLYNAFVPQELLDIGVINAKSTTGLNNQTIGMIGLGVVALLAGAFLGRRS